MSDIREFSRHDRRYDEASKWLARLDNNPTAADRNSLQAWMSADTENQQVLLEMARLWDKMAVLSRLSDLFPNRAPEASGVPGFLLATAATIVVAVTAGVWLIVANEVDSAPESPVAEISPVSDTVHATSIGEQSTVDLPDGTQVVLNTSSRIAVRYSDAHRMLVLERGEIHVEVAEDRTRPMSVVVGNNIVRAVSTAFSLEFTGDQRIELVVTKGDVMVGAHDSALVDGPAGAAAVLAPDAVTVAAGESIILGTSDREIVAISPEEIEVRLSWRNGNLIFAGEPLEEAVREIGRYTTVEFVILDDAIKSVQIAGEFKAGDVDGLLATLREDFDIVHQHGDGGKIFLTSM